MGDAHYPLKVVLRLRERERDAAKDELSSALAELRRRENALRVAREAVKEVQSRISTADEERIAAFIGGADLRDLRVMEDYRCALEVDEANAAEQLKRDRSRVGAQRREVAHAREALAAAQRALMGVEEHFASWRKEQEALRRRKEADAMDEIATRMWMEDTR